MTTPITRLKILYLAALVLPTLFLGMNIAFNLWHRHAAPAYVVVVEGYDPRDYVYGEYLQFRLRWDDARSQKPDNVKPDDLPQVSRLYLPEGQGWDLQEMLRENKNDFRATVLLMGRRTQLRDLTIDGARWQDGLEQWRAQKAATPPCTPGLPGCTTP